MTASTLHGEAREATRGSAIKLGAEIASRLLLLATTLLLMRGLGASGFGLYNELSVYAVLVAELGELGLQNLASRALVAGTVSFGALVRARLLLASPLSALTLVALAVSSRALPAGAATALVLLIAWFALSGWGEFLGVALRCRGARASEALVLVALRGGGLVAVAFATAAGGGLRGTSLALALSPFPALGLALLLLSASASRGRAGGPAPELAPLTVLRESFPLALHGGLLLLSPRVELLVMSWWVSDHALGLFAMVLTVIWFLSMVPSAIAAGAMPALTREALRGLGFVRRRTALTLSVLAVPAAAGLALVAPSLVAVLVAVMRGESRSAAQLVSAPLQLLAAALPALFLNALLASALIAAGRASWLPRLTAARVALAFLLAAALVPGQGAIGAALGLVAAEWALLGAARFACRRAGFAVPVARPLALALAVSVPMALAVNGVTGRLAPALGAGAVSAAVELALAVTIGALTWAATLAAGLVLAPRTVRQLTGDVRYP